MNVIKFHVKPTQSFFLEAALSESTTPQLAATIVLVQGAHGGALGGGCLCFQPVPMCILLICAPQGFLGLEV